jgi:hypothetical protein
MGLNSTSFKYLRQVLALAIVRIVTSMKAHISIETKFVITLSKLRNENILLACGEIYGVAIGITSIIVRVLCSN